MPTLKLTAIFTYEQYEKVDTATNKKWKDEFGTFRKKAGFKSTGNTESDNQYIHTWITDKTKLTGIYYRSENKTIKIEVILECNEIPLWYEQFLLLLYKTTTEVTTEYDTPLTPISVVTSPPLHKIIIDSKPYFEALVTEYNLHHKPFSKPFIEGWLRLLSNHDKQLNTKMEEL